MREMSSLQYEREGLTILIYLIGLKKLSSLTGYAAGIKNDSSNSAFVLKDAIRGVDYISCITKAWRDSAKRRILLISWTMCDLQDSLPISTSTRLKRV